MLKILEAAVLSQTEPVHGPGYVIRIGDDETRAGVVTGDGIMEIKRVQIEGKRVLPAAEFLKGQRSFIGSILGTTR